MIILKAFDINLNPWKAFQHLFYNRKWLNFEEIDRIPVKEFMFFAKKKICFGCGKHQNYLVWLWNKTFGWDEKKMALNAWVLAANQLRTHLCNLFVGLLKKGCDCSFLSFSSIRTWLLLLWSQVSSVKTKIDIDLHGLRSRQTVISYIQFENLCS